MKTLKIWGLIGVFILISQIIYAQNTIKGKIIDSTNKQTLSSVNIYIPEQKTGTTSDKNGRFLLKNLPIKNHKIQFSHLGYKTILKTLNPNTSDTLFEIQMDPSVLKIEEVVISGGSYSTQHENAIKIDLIKSEDLTNIGSPTFMKSLENIPGVDLINKGVGVISPVIRGLSRTNILMLNNGVKMENFQFSENHPFIVDEFGIDRIEIIKGPASLLYGSDAIGGVINLIRENPPLTESIRGDYNLQYHSNTQGYVNNIGVNGRTKNIFYGIRAGSKSHMDYIDGESNSVPNTRFNENTIKANFGLNKSYGLFQLYYNYNEPKLGMCVGEAIPFITENGRDNNVWYQNLINHLISSKNTLFLKKYKLDINSALQINNRQLQTDENKPSFKMVDMDLKTFSSEIKLYFPYKKNREYIIGIQEANKTNKNNDAPNHVLPDASVNDLSIFSLAQYLFFNRLKTQAGLRYDFRTISTIEEVNKKAINNKYGNISSSLGATYIVNEKLLLRANIASAYRTPNIAELTENGIHGVRYEEGNADLKSQRSYEIDVSTHYHSKLMVFDLSGFYNQIKDYIFLSPTIDTTTNGYRIYRYAQSDSKIYGGETTIHLLPISWLQISTTYSYLVGKQKNGDYLSFIPQNKLRLEFIFKKEKIFFLNNLSFKVAGVLAEEQNNPSPFETNTDSYFLLNTQLGTKINVLGQIVSFTVHANNILNETYIDHLSTLKELGYYNIGRNISLNIKVPFKIK